MLEESEQKREPDENAFATLEKRFQEVLDELVGDKNLEKYRVEYEKLAKALSKSHESEKRLMTKCRELSAEMVSNSVKLDAARKLSEEDKDVAETLKKEIEKAWRMVDAAHEREVTAKDTIQNLKHEISNLTKLIEQGAGASMGQEHSLNDVLNVKSELVKERDELLTEVTNIRESLTKAIASQQEMETLKGQDMETILQLQQDIQVRQNECSRETRKRERLEKEAKQLQSELDARQAEIKALSLQGQRSREEQQRLEQQLREQKILSERAAKELEQLQVRNSKLQQENEQSTLNVEQLSLENQQRTSDLKMREEEVNQMRQEISKLTKMREAAQRKCRQMEDQKVEVEQQRDTLKNQIAGLEREMESSKKQIEIDKKAMDELVRERDILNKNLIKAAQATDKQMGEVKLHEQSKKHLEQEILNYRDEAQKQRKIIYQLEKERDRYINEASDLTHKVLQHMEDIKVREMQIFDYRKKIAEAETKLKQQQNLYEAVRSDRNLYSKHLNESQVEITEMKRQLKIMNHQVDQLKEEISVKESALVKEHLDFQRVEKEKESLKAELQKMKQQAQETKQFIDNQEAEERKLLKIIGDADAERLRQKKQLDQVISERDILGTQLVHRNEQLALLYEKIKIQQSMLNKGEMQYNQRVEDIRLLKLEIKKLRREKGILTKTVANVEDLRCEVFHMQRELLRERTRCRALEEELESPMNVHRWRKLEACDPATFQLIQKIHSLQRRLITKSEEVVEKELLLQEKEKLYVELKHILARQPGPEVAEQIQIYQADPEGEDEAAQGIVIRAEHKRKEQQSREKERSLAQPLIQPQRSDGPRYTGGGFSIKQPSRIAA
ncbi:hypothetical protein AAFF_G00380170 [Aldrovandia affinis]|uniref:Cilia- and flagella-associated protein 58 central coiled coil domain-containing protein n=1 Tax=Aldrovandia affinis TaxID=143900 RepID=A0AAD7X0Q1_9TELE|nr:hypothetical protein AAFF_G00380170 [Aldrovandia affinis]